jgi:hypothetical protein
MVGAMKSWSVYSGAFSPISLERYKRAQKIVDAIPDGIEELEGFKIRCHELARVVSVCLEVPFVDGKYGAVEHSWLEWVDRTKHRTILDVYAVGVEPMVQLVHSPIGLLNLWQPGEFRDDINFHVVDTLLSIVRDKL